jgi:uncharacterized membrane protein HdeD (DUF308 family)
MTDDLAERAAMRQIASLWWVTLAIGVLSIIAGVIVLIKPSNSLATIAVVVGIFVLIEGIFALISSLSHDTENRGLTAILGVLSLVVGIFLIRHPVHGVTVVAMFVGIWLIVMGSLRLVLAFETVGHRGWRITVAIVEIVAGIVIVASPNIGIATLAILVGISLILNGVTLAALGFVLHSAKDAVREMSTGRSAPAI